jgi:hypothetical protein
MYTPIQPLVAALVLSAIVLLAGVACGGEAEAPATAVTQAPAPASTTITGLKVHPLGTRTGVPIVDAVVAAAEQGDAQKLATLVHYYTLPCQRGGMAAVPCASGQPVGSPSQVFGGGVCEGDFYLRGDPAIPGVLANFLKPSPPTQPGPPPLDARLYAVIKRVIFPSEPRVPGEYLIVFASGHVLSVDSQGLTWFSLACGVPSSPESYVSGGFVATGQTLLLPPR